MLLALRSLWTKKVAPVAAKIDELLLPGKRRKPLPERKRDEALDVVKVLTEWLERS